MPRFQFGGQRGCPVLSEARNRDEGRTQQQQNDNPAPQAVGTNANDLIQATPGNTSVRTGDGNDVVILPESAGRVTVTDFDPVRDKIDFRHFDNVNNANDVISNFQIFNSRDGAVFQQGDRSIVLEDVNVNQLGWVNVSFGPSEQGRAASARAFDENIAPFIDPLGDRNSNVNENNEAFNFGDGQGYGGLDMSCVGGDCSNDFMFG